MGNLDDLTNKKFGYLKVLYRTNDHITISGQKKVYWMCECQLCGRMKSIGAQQLKRGKTISCGCLPSLKKNSCRNKKICIICGKEFLDPKSNNKVTCSKKCQIEYASKRRAGKKHTEESKQKISKSAQGRNMYKLQIIAVEAAKKSPRSGRFKTNVNAIDWHIISPDGKHYYFHSLAFWLRENGEELFGCKPDSAEYRNVLSGLSGAKRAMLGGNYACSTYKGWQVIPTKDDQKN